MTGQQLFDTTTSLMGIAPADATSYQETILPQINIILAKTFNLENNNRAYKSLALLTSIPELTALSQTIDYQQNVLMNVVVYGLAQLLALSDSDTINAGFFETRFADGMRNESKLIASDIEDYFSPEAD